ncbi:P-loop containing nucleoside triphosphate hydrolase protein [Chytridium lagenaria]|nr:P-loop containing nucleoside triphosphate hydrolase protein [Chytridium lagenaria]
MAKGQWSPSMCRQVSQKEVSLRVPVYAARVMKNLFVLWQVDVAWSPIKEVHTQIIKVWTIGTVKEIREALGVVSKFHKSYSSKHIKQCDMREGFHDWLDTRPIPFEVDETNKPATVVHEKRGEHSDQDYNLSPFSEATEAGFLADAKFVTLSKDIQSFEFPFCLSEEEDGILKHPDSMVICGRSGTGKTSCLIFRMLSRYFTARSSGLLDEEMPKQVFITASPGFCNRIKEYFNEILNAITKGDYQDPTTGITLSARAERFLEALPHGLEGGRGMNLRDDEFDRMVSGGLIEESLDDFMEEGERESQWTSFEDIRPSEYPIFVSFRKYLMLLWRTLNPEEKVCFSSDGIDERLFSDIDYFLFLENFWKRISFSMKRDLDPSLVFNEIRGVIKGSEGAAMSAKGYLPKEEYLNVSKRRYTAFTRCRDQVYEIFEAYHRPTRPDTLDIVNNLNRKITKSFNKNGASLALVDEIYVDEVQDLTMAELRLLISTCTSLDSGLVFAGDTAQTITHGSLFRFEDLRSMLYRYMESRRRDDHRTVQVPKLTHLIQNYRSHNGILEAAATVLDLVVRFFRETVDDLPRDAGLLSGPPPIWIADSDAELRKFVCSLTFGSEQVMLTRTEKDRADLAKLCPFALIMTIEEAKVEFCWFPLEGNWCALSSF